MLSICIGFLGCAGIQTQPTCKLLQSGQVSFYNYSFETNPYVVVHVCKFRAGADLDDFTEIDLECLYKFWLKKYHVWLRLPEGQYYIQISTRNTVKAVRVEVQKCKSVMVEFK